MRSPRIRFAFRLAIALGIADPVAWIDTVDPYVIDCWLAYDAVEPIPFPWLQSATIAAEVYRSAEIAGIGKIERLQPKRVKDFMPAIPDAADRSARMSPDQMAAWAAGKVRLG